MSKAMQRRTSWARSRWIDGLRRHVTPKGVRKLAIHFALNHLERFGAETTPNQVLRYTNFYERMINRLQ